MTSDIRLDEVLRRIDVYGRLAFGAQVVAAMGLIAGPILLVTSIIACIVVWDDNRGEALFFGIAGALSAIGAFVGSIALEVVAWRWSGDWITEWGGYAVGAAIAIVANALLAYLLTSTPIPIPLSFALCIGAAFTVGVVVAGNLAGTHVLSEQREERQRALAKRR